MRRRTLLRILGGSLVVLGGGAGLFAATRRPDRALAPWDVARYDGDPRLQALAYAILAPNPHNRQPWIADLAEPGVVTLTCDLARRLPQTDPLDRQIVIGLGCFVELLRLAAAEAGQATRLEPFPLGAPAGRLDERPVARVVFTGAAAVPDPLFAQVLARRSNKEPYDTARPVAAADLARVAAAAGLEADPGAVGFAAEAAEVARLRDLTWRAHLVEVTTPRTLRESVDLMRLGKGEIEASPDGIDIGGFFPEALLGLGLMERADLADPGSAAFRQGLEIYEALHRSAMAHLWLTTPGDGKADALAAGQAWVRLHLAATAAGIALHPLSQALQEFPEMAALKAELEGALGVAAPRRLQMLARLGYGPATEPSPRWPVERCIRT
jgi:hypothetical protein